jgi:4-diphosphocytidyl-2-C-methyl-D-erythritol kinase
MLVIESPAKVNLCLRVLGRREDGYHDIETIFHAIGLYDRLTFTPRSEPGVEVDVTSGEAPQGEKNLCWKAAQLLMERTGVRRGAYLSLEKRIPVRSGLGGGSSDAAAVLVGLSHLWELSMKPDELATLAAEVGADVPFFLRGGCVLGRGKGERLTSCPGFAAWLVLVAPERGVSTAQAYASLRRGASLSKRRAPSAPVQKMLQALKQQDLALIAQALRNDFEAAPITGVETALEAKRELLAAGCLGATMSGSGSAVYGITREQAQAEVIAEALRGHWPWVAIAPTLPQFAGPTITTGEGE